MWIWLRHLFLQCSRLSSIALKNHCIRMALTALLFSTELLFYRSSRSSWIALGENHKNGSLHCCYLLNCSRASVLVLFKSFIPLNLFKDVILLSL